jgi:ribosomal protein L37E
MITGQHIIKCKKCGDETLFNDLTRNLCAWCFIGRTKADAVRIKDIRLGIRRYLCSTLSEDKKA